MIEGFVHCRVCGNPTKGGGDPICTICYQLETRIKCNPDIARIILGRLDHPEETPLTRHAREVMDFIGRRLHLSPEERSIREAFAGVLDEDKMEEVKEREEKDKILLRTALEKLRKKKK